MLKVLTTHHPASTLQAESRREPVSTRASKSIAPCYTHRFTTLKTEPMPVELGSKVVGNGSIAIVTIFQDRQGRHVCARVAHMAQHNLDLLSIYLHGGSDGVLMACRRRRMPERHSVSVTSAAAAPLLGFFASLPMSPARSDRESKRCVSCSTTCPSGRHLRTGSVFTGSWHRPSSDSTRQGRCTSRFDQTTCCSSAKSRRP